MVMNFCCATPGAPAPNNTAPASVRIFRCTFILFPPSWISIFELCDVRRAETADRGIDRVAEALDNGIDLLRIDDKRRREQHMVAAHAVDRAAGRIDHQPARHRL